MKLGTALALVFVFTAGTIASGCDDVAQTLWGGFGKIGANGCPSGKQPFVCNDAPDTTVTGRVSDPQSCNDSFECSSRPCGLMLCATDLPSAFAAAAQPAGLSPGDSRVFCSLFAPGSPSVDAARSAIRAIEINWIASTGGYCLTGGNGDAGTWASLGQTCASWLTGDEVPPSQVCCSTLTCNLGPDGLSDTGTCCIPPGGYCTADISCCTPQEVCGATGNGPTCCIAAGYSGICDPNDDQCCPGTSCVQSADGNGFVCQ